MRSISLLNKRGMPTLRCCTDLFRQSEPKYHRRKINSRQKYFWTCSCMFLAVVIGLLLIKAVVFLRTPIPTINNVQSGLEDKNHMELDVTDNIEFDWDSPFIVDMPLVESDAWSKEFHQWITEMKPNDRLVFSARFYQHGKFIYSLEYVESKRWTREADQQFVVDFTNEANHRHGGLELDLKTVAFKVQWGARFDMLFNAEDEELDENSRCSYDYLQNIRYHIVCKSVLFTDSSSREPIDSFEFRYTLKIDETD